MFYRIRIPLFIYQAKNPKKGTKKYWLNLNQYRNWYRYSNNKIKKKFGTDHATQLRRVFQNAKLQNKILYVHYMVIRGNKATFDTLNYGSVVDKFFMDLLQKEKIITNDTHEDVVWGSFSVFPEIDKSLKFHHMDIIIGDEPMFDPTKEFSDYLSTQYTGY